MELTESPRRLAALLSLALGILAALITATGYVLTEQRAATLGVNQAITRQLEAIRLADHLRQSSDDLTRMVRSYVVTGDSFGLL